MELYDHFMDLRITDPEYKVILVEMEFLKAINMVHSEGITDRVAKVISMIKSKDMVDKLRTSPIKFESRPSIHLYYNLARLDGTQKNEA